MRASILAAAALAFLCLLPSPTHAQFRVSVEGSGSASGLTTAGTPGVAVIIVMFGWPPQIRPIVVRTRPGMTPTELADAILAELLAQGFRARRSAMSDQQIIIEAGPGGAPITGFPG